MQMNSLIVAVLAMITVGGIFYAFVYPYLTGEAQAEQRQKALTSNAVVKRTGDRNMDAATRRKQIADSLKEVEAKGKKKKRTLETKIAQAGLAWSKKQFYAFSAACAVGGMVILLLLTSSPIYSVPGVLIGGFGFCLLSAESAD